MENEQAKNKSPQEEKVNESLMIKKYQMYLKFLEKKLGQMFEAQKPYIFCKKGCGKCCQNAEFPYSKLETTYLIRGFFQLPKEVQAQVEEKIIATIEKKKKNKEKLFYYDCPFLINDECCVYEYRGIICRAFGLLSKGDGDKIKTPFCCFKGLNYSNIYDEETKTLSDKKMKELNLTQTPIAYNISYEFLTGDIVKDAYKIDFGEKKPLIDWFMPDEEDNKPKEEQ